MLIKGNNVKVTKYVDFSADIVDEKEEVKGSDLVVEELDKKDPEIPDQGEDNKGNGNTGNGNGNDISGNNAQSKPEVIKPNIVKTIKIKETDNKNSKK